MAERARVGSVEALESFRSHLVVYLSQARPALEEISAEMVRIRLWLENDRRTYWESQYRRRAKALEEAQQALFSARISTLRTENANSVEQLAVHRAKRALDEAEQKLRVIKKWCREFDSRVQPPLKQVEKLHTVLTNEMALALASLTQTINTLSAYAEVKLMEPESTPLPTPTEANSPPISEVPPPAGGAS